MLNNKELKCIEDNFSDVIQKNEYFVKTKQWIICKFDVDTKPVAIYHNSGKMIVKAAGCNKDEMKLDDSLYNMRVLPVGTRVFPKLENDSYWEKTCSGDEAFEELFYTSLLI